MKLPIDDRTAELARLYGDAEVRLRSLVAGAVSRGAKGTARYYALQLATAHKLLSDLQDEAIPQATQIIASGYLQGAHFADVTLQASGTFSGVHTHAVDVLADNLANKLNDAAVTVGRQVEDVFRRVALNEVTIGLIEGTTRAGVSDAMRERFIQQGITGFVDKGGRRWKLADYTQMVARTTTREAVSMGTANRMLEHGHDLITVSEHGGSDESCDQYAGNTYSITGQTPGYDVLDQYPPFHPNCVHVITPAAATFEAFERAVNSPEARDVSAVLA